MRRILAIFRKDARHLWPQAAALAVLMGLAALLDPTYTGWPAAYYDLLPSFALPLTCWLVVISAIHEERLPGDRQYWLTRPYSRKELVIAKILLIAAFVNLPLLAYHAGVYAALGIPPADHLKALLWRQVFFTIFYILPAAALAAITRSLSRAFAIALLSGVGAWLGDIGFMFLARRPLIIGQTPDAATTILRAVLLAAGVSVILALQYARRKTALAGALAAAIALVVFATAAYRPAQSRQPLVPGKEEARLLLDPEPDRHSGMRPAADPDLDVFDLPVRLDGAAAGVALDQAYVDLTIESYNGRRIWRFTRGELYGLTGRRGWLTFSSDRFLLVQAEGKPAEVSGSFDLRLFGGPLVLPLPKGSAVVVPGVGVCRSSGEGPISFLCYSPSPRAALTVGIPGLRSNWIVSPGSVEGSIPTASGFRPVTKFASLVSYDNWEQVGDMKLIAAQPLPQVRVTFRLYPVPLREYLMTGRR